MNFWLILRTEHLKNEAESQNIPNNMLSTKIRTEIQNHFTMSMSISHHKVVTRERFMIGHWKLFFFVFYQMSCLKKPSRTKHQNTDQKKTTTKKNPAKIVLQTPKSKLHFRNWKQPEVWIFNGYHFIKSSKTAILVSLNNVFFMKMLRNYDVSAEINTQLLS